MADDQQTSHENAIQEPQEIDYGPKGKVDMVSYLYVVGGIPCMIAFFVILFSLVNACDQANVYIPV